MRDLIKDNLSQKRSKGLFYGKDWNIQKVNKVIKYEDYDNRIELNSIGLNGDHQLINAGMCIASLKILQKEGRIEVNDHQIKECIQRTGLEAGVQIIYQTD